MTKPTATQYGTVTSTPEPRSSVTAPPSTTVQNDSARYLHVEGGRASVKSFARRVYIAPNIYIKTNFYIKQSGNYVGDNKLTQFVYFRRMQWVYLAIVVASFFAVFSTIFSFLSLAVNAAFFIIWSQHMYVVFTTMPLVLRQPSLPDNRMSLSNDHLQISIDQFRADFAETNDELIGIVGGNRTSGKIQVFKHSTVSLMKKCMAVSIISFIACVTMLIYCSACGILGALLSHY